MRKRRILAVITALFAIILTAFFFITELVDFIGDLTNLLVFSVKSMQEWLGWLGTLISTTMFFKLKFIDTGMFNKLEKTFGKARFIKALRVILRMLDGYDPDTIIRKVLLVSDMEIEMGTAVEELKKLIVAEHLDPDCELKLSKTEERKLKREIRKLLNLIDKKIEVHALSKGLDNYLDGNIISAIDELREATSKQKEKKDKLEEHNKENKKKQNEKLRKNLCK